MTCRGNDRQGLQNGGGAARTEQIRALIVDDDEINRTVVSLLLAQYGVLCDLAESGARAIELAALTRYDLIFMDHMMPGMDGAQTAQRIRAAERPEHAAVIVGLTAAEPGEAEAAFSDAGVDECLPKPLEADALARLMQRWSVQDAPARAAGPLHGQGPDPDCWWTAVEELDWPLALARLGGRADALTQALGILTRRLPQVCGRLEDFLAQDDLHGFSIEVHGVKGSLRNVGLSAPAILAGELETRAKQGDAAFCRAHTPALVDRLEGLRQKLAERMPAEAAPPQAGTAQQLALGLTLAREALAAFEQDGALTRLRAAARYDYGTDENGLLTRLIHSVEEFDFAAATALIDRALDAGQKTKGEA